MRRVLKWLGIGTGVLAALALAAVAFVWIASDQVMARKFPVRPEPLPRPSLAVIAQAPHQMRILGCFSCHGEGLRGNLMFHEENVANIWAPNVPLKISGMSDEQVAQVIRQGVKADGTAVWVMPSKSMSRLTPEETAAIVAYLRTLPRTGRPTPPIQLLPLGRIGVITRKFNPEPVHLASFKASYPADLGPQHAAGRKFAALVCAECHGPALEGMRMEDGNQPPSLDVVGAYDLPAFTALMRTGTAPGGRELGLMTAIAKENLKHMTDAEIASLYGYLKARADKTTAPAS